MLSKLFLASALATITLSAYAATDLPDACGKADVKFDVKTEKTPAPASFDSSHARIIFIGAMHSNGVTVFPKPTTRFGMDGQWLGAVKGNSYLIVLVSPGEHHLCAATQEPLARDVRKHLDVASLTAEAGKTYVFQFMISYLGTGAQTDVTTELSALDDYEGKYRLKDIPLATGTPKP